jgi:Uma2 family endonuclease
MNAPARKRLTVPEFLAWAQSQPNGRHELVRGEIIAMAPERWQHVEAKQRIFLALRDAIRRGGVACQAMIDGLAVVIDGDTSYIPDVLVNCGQPGAPESMIAPNPVIVVEVLSPSSGAIDKTVKLADYFRVAGLMHTLIVDGVRRRVLHHRRQPGGDIAVMIRTEGEIGLDPPGIAVAVASLLD